MGSGTDETGTDGSDTVDDVVEGTVGAEGIEIGGSGLEGSDTGGGTGGLAFGNVKVTGCPGMELGVSEIVNAKPPDPVRLSTSRLSVPEPRCCSIRGSGLTADAPSLVSGSWPCASRRSSRSSAPEPATSATKSESTAGSI